MYSKKENWLNKKVFFKYWQIFLIILIILSNLVLMAIVYTNYNKINKKIINRTEKHESGYKYISPLLDCADNNNLYSHHLENKLNKIIEKSIKDKKVDLVSLYYRDLNNGPWIGVNENEEFSPASLLKVPLMIAYLKIAENEPEILKKKITIGSENDSIIQNINPDKQVQKNTEYTIEELIEYMIIYSDNRASNALVSHMENIDVKKLDRIYSDLGMEVPGETKLENFMKIKDYASFFRILYNSSYLNREMSEKALSLLSQSDFQQGIRAHIPSYINIANKFGERVLSENKQLHDCGIIYKINNPYILCVMTRGHDFNLMSEVIKEISQSVYDETNFK